MLPVTSQPARASTPMATAFPYLNALFVHNSPASTTQLHLTIASAWQSHAKEAATALALRTRAHSAEICQTWADAGPIRVEVEAWIGLSCSSLDRRRPTPGQLRPNSATFAPMGSIGPNPVPQVHLFVGELTAGALRRPKSFSSRRIAPMCFSSTPARSSLSVSQLMWYAHHRHMCVASKGKRKTRSRFPRCECLGGLLKWLSKCETRARAAG